MKIKSITIRQPKTVDKVYLTTVGSGYLQGESGSLPDVDIDFQSDRRQEVKEYLERRYNLNDKQRVFSAGTLTTLKLKAVFKDVCRIHGVPPKLANKITKCIKDDSYSWTDLMLFAYEEKNEKYKRKNVYNFIQTYPEVIADIRYIMGQPRSASIHASAIIITPDEKCGEPAECFDFLPIKKMDGVLVSEIDGYSIDDIGLLKNDILGVKELSKIKMMLNILKEKYNKIITIPEVAVSDMDDPKAYNILCKGFTQNVFQFSSEGMTRFITEMKPSRFDDLVAATSLFRPAALESGSAEKYNDCKHGLVAPTYLWGTHEILKDTYGVLCYQEQLAQMAREIGGFTIGEGVKLVKLISKKKTDKIHEMKDKFLLGAKEKGCPDDDAVKIWDMIESGGSYLFNRCISGDESIYRLNGGKFIPTIAEMYKIKNDLEYAKKTGHTSLRSKYKINGYGYGFSLNNENRLVKNKIIDIRYVGKKPMYKIHLESGDTIKCTPNHKHPTNRGMVRTDLLQVNKDKMLVNIGHIPQDTSYRFTNKGGNNHEDYHSNNYITDYKLNSQKGVEGFIENPDSEYVKLKNYKDNFMLNCCEKCGKKDNVRLEVHHINGNHATTGNNFDNLQTLCPSCHKKEHYKMGRTKMGERGLYTKQSTVVKIEYIGIEDAYDVEMDSPYHTFATFGGIVTCNSHATAYSVHSYIGAYIKANYPTAFYTVALEFANDDEIPAIISEMEQASNAKIVAPDINVSSDEFITDYQNDKIYWSLSRISMAGSKVTDRIMEDRSLFGKYKSMKDFIERIFIKKRIENDIFELRKVKEPITFYFTTLEHKDGKEARSYMDDVLAMGHYGVAYEMLYGIKLTDEQMKFVDKVCEKGVRCPVTSLHVKNFIYSGCFDNLEGVTAVTERKRLYEEASVLADFPLDDFKKLGDVTSKHYYWSTQQVKISGIGSVDYKRIYDNSDFKDVIKKIGKYVDLEDVVDADNDGKTVKICATISEIYPFSFQNKKGTQNCARVILMQNQCATQMTIWDEKLKEYDHIFNQNNIGKIVIGVAKCQYNDYYKENTLNTIWSSQFKLI